MAQGDDLRSLLLPEDEPEGEGGVQVGDVARGLGRGIVGVGEGLLGAGEAAGEIAHRKLAPTSSLRTLLELDQPRPFPGSRTLGAGAIAAGRALGRARRAVGRTADEVIGSGGGLDFQTGQAVGSALGIGALSLAGTAVGIPPVASAAFLGAATQSAEGYREALESFEDPESEEAQDAALTAFVAGGAIGTTEAIPIAGQVGRFLGRADRASGGALRRALMHAGLEAGEELGQENLQAVLSDVVAKHVSKHDEEREVLGEFLDRWQSGEAWLPPIVAGGLLSAVASVGEARERPAAKAPGKPKAEPSPLVTPTPREPVREPSEKARRVAARWMGEQGLVGEVVPPRTPRQRAAAAFFQARGAEAVFVQLPEEGASPAGYSEGVAVFDANVPGHVLETRLVLHEAQHHLRQLVKEEEETFAGLSTELEGAIRTLDPTGVERIEARVRDEYAERGLDEAGIADEVVSNYLEEHGALLFEEARFKEALAQPALGRRLVDAIIRMVRKLGIKLETSVEKKLRALRDQLAETEGEQEIDPKVIPEIASLTRRVFAELAERTVPRETSPQQAPDAQETPSTAVRPLPGGPEVGGRQHVQGLQEGVRQGARPGAGDAVPEAQRPAATPVPAADGARDRGAPATAVRKAGAAVPRAPGGAPRVQGRAQVPGKVAVPAAPGRANRGAEAPARAPDPNAYTGVLTGPQKRRLEQKRGRVQARIAEARAAGKTELAQRLELQLSKLPRPPVDVRAEATRSRRAQPSAREVEIAEAEEKGDREFRFAVRREHFEKGINPLPVPADAKQMLERKRKRKAGVGTPKNARTSFRLKGGGQFTVGWTNVLDWWRNLEAVGLSKEDMERARYWYEEARKHFSETGDAWPNFVTAWLLANKNVDVTGATLNALRGREHVLAPSVGPKAGMSEDTMRQFWNFVEKGEGSLEGLAVGQKLYDFLDAALLRKTRQWMGNDPRAGSPFVVDVHSFRDLGYVDDVLLNWLRENVVESQQHLVEKLVIDTKGAPNETQYERAAERGLRVQAWLEKSGKLGAGWESWQVQALGWIAMQRRLGMPMGFPSLTLPALTRSLPFEVLPGEGTPRAKELEALGQLDEEEVASLTRATLDAALDAVLRLVGSPPILSKTFARGGWKDALTPGVVLRIASSPEAGDDLAAALAYVLEQTEVGIGKPLRMTKSEEIPSGANAWFVDFAGEGLKTEEGRTALWRALRQHLPEIAGGFHATPSGLRIAVPTSGPDALRKFQGKTGLERLDALVEGKMGALNPSVSGAFDVKVAPGRWTRSTNDWKTHPDGQGHLQRLGSRYGPDVRRGLDRARAAAGKAFTSELERIAGRRAQRVAEPLRLALLRVSGGARTNALVGPGGTPALRRERVGGRQALERALGALTAEEQAAPLAPGTSLVALEDYSERVVPKSYDQRGKKLVNTEDLHGIILDSPLIERSQYVLTHEGKVVSNAIWAAGNSSACFVMHPAHIARGLARMFPMLSGIGPGPKDYVLWSLHNHPSGASMPSHADIGVAQSLESGILVHSAGRRIEVRHALVANGTIARFFPDEPVQAVRVAPPEPRGVPVRGVSPVALRREDALKILENFKPPQGGAIVVFVDAMNLVRAAWSVPEDLWGRRLEGSDQAPASGVLAVELRERMMHYGAMRAFAHEATDSQVVWPRGEVTDVLRDGTFSWLDGNMSVKWGMNISSYGSLARKAPMQPALVFSLGSSLRRNLYSRGNMPRELFGSKIQRDAWINAHARRSADLDVDLRRAARKHFGRSPSAADLERIDRAFKDPVALNALPADLRAPVRAMRDHVRELSMQLITSGAIDGDLVPKVLANLDFYATRSYRVFDDPKWAERVPLAVRNRAKAYLRSSYPTYTDNQLERLINELLYEGKAAQTPIALLARGQKVGSKDLSILKKRKQIAPEIRELFGEYKDVRVNYARSVAKMSFLVGNHQFLEEVRAKGLGQHLWDPQDPNVPAEAKAKFASEESSVLFPLNGLVATPELVEAFEDQVEREQLPMWAQAWLTVNGIAKYGKTVGSVMTQLRNWAGNLPFAMAQGHFRAHHFAKSLRTVATSFHVMNAQTWRDYYRKAIELGVVHESANASELRAVLEDVWSRGPAIWSPTSVRGRARRALDFMTRLYGAGDDFWKIYAFENEKARYQKTGAFKTQAELEAHAAAIVRDTYPTYSMVPRAVRKLRRFPILGTFVSFPWEVMRTAKNTLELMTRELKSKNNRVRAIGAQRLAGSIMAAGWSAALTAYARNLLGMTDDEDDAARELLPEWSKHADILWLGMDERGNRLYVDLSYSDPYKYLKQPLFALLRGEGWREKLAESTGALLEPFVSEEIATRAGIDLMRNRTDEGYPVYNEAAPAEDQFVDVAQHLGKAVEPGTLTSLRRIYLGTQGVVIGTKAYDPAVETLALTTGVRVSRLDTLQGVYKKAGDFAEQSALATRMLSDELRQRGTVTDEDIEDAYEGMEAVRLRAWNRLQRAVSAARGLGQTDKEIRARLEPALGKERAALVIRGRYEPYAPSASFLGKQIKSGSREDRKEFLRRTAVVRRLQRARPTPPSQ